MIIWLALFLIIVIASFILAFLSMKDYQELPQFQGDNSLYLIQNPSGLSVNLIQRIHQLTVQAGQIISLERLFKGGQSALVIFGPKVVLEKFSQELNLLELEDYSGVDNSKVVVWEVGKKDQGDLGNIDNLFAEVDGLQSSEQFWWQLTLQPKKMAPESILEKLIEPISQFLGLKSTATWPFSFQSQIRAALFSENTGRRKELTTKLQSLGSGKLIKLPRPFSSDQLYQNYIKRATSPFDTSPLILKPEEVLSLLGRG